MRCENWNLLDSNLAIREALAIPWPVLGIVQIAKFERSLSVTKVF